MTTLEYFIPVAITDAAGIFTYKLSIWIYK